MDNSKIKDAMLLNKRYQRKYKTTQEKEPIIDDKPTEDFISWIETFAIPAYKKQKAAKKEKKAKKKKNTEISIKPPEIQISIPKRAAKTETVGGAIKVPKVFKGSYVEEWEPIIKKEQEMYLAGKKIAKGFIILVDGKPKTGKSHWAQSAVEFKGYTSKYRDVPAGYPVWVVEADEAARSETESKWSKYLPSKENPEGLIHIANCYIEDEDSGMIDPVATLEDMNKKIFALRDKKQGTLVIDPFSLYCNLVLYTYMIKSPNKGKTGTSTITFNEFLKPDRQIQIVEYQYKKKLIYGVLRKLRRFNIHVVLIADVKDKYSDEGGLYDNKTVGVVSDVQKGTESWVDIIGRFYKEKIVRKVKGKDGSITQKTIMKRYLAITDCRFEEKEISSEKFKFEAPTFGQVIAYLMKVYPK